MTYYENNKEKCKIAASRWDANNREKRNKWAAERWALKKAARDVYKASPEGVAEVKAKKEAVAQKRKAYVAQWRLDNPEKLKEMSDRTRLKNRDRRLAQTAEWRAKNKEHLKAYQVAHDAKRAKKRGEINRAKYAADPEAARAYQRAWRLEHPEIVANSARTSKARRRAAKAATGGSYTQAEIEALFTMQNARCANPYCCIEITMKDGHLDHIYPLLPRDGEKQGSNGIENLSWLCQPCNQRKTNLDPAEWAKREARRAGLF